MRVDGCDVIVGVARRGNVGSGDGEANNGKFTDANAGTWSSEDEAVGVKLNDAKCGVDILFDVMKFCA